MDIQTHSTSEEILDNPTITQDAFSCCGGLTYEITESELGWLDFIKGSYSIADYLYSNLSEKDGKIIVAINGDFSSVLDKDCNGAGKAIHGKKIGYYDIISAASDLIKIGCHKIKMLEVERIAQELNW